MEADFEARTTNAATGDNQGGGVGWANEHEEEDESNAEVMKLANRAIPGDDLFLRTGKNKNILPTRNILVVLLSLLFAVTVLTLEHSNSGGMIKYPGESRYKNQTSGMLSSSNAFRGNIDMLPQDFMDQRNLPYRIDYSCRVHQDCAIKDAGICCGVFYSCVNSNYTPVAAKKSCQKSSRSSSCEWQDINRCYCQKGICKGFQDPLHIPP